MFKTFVWQRRGHWNYSWNYLSIFFTLLPIHRKRDIKTGRSCLRTNIEATQRERSTYTIIRSRNLLGGRSLAVLLPPALSPRFFIPKLLFKTSLARLPFPSTRSSACSLRQCTFSARLNSAVTAILSSTDPPPFTLLSSSAPIVSSKNSKSCSKLQAAQIRSTDPSDLKMETAILTRYSEKKFCFTLKRWSISNLRSYLTYHWQQGKGSRRKKSNSLMSNFPQHFFFRKCCNIKKITAYGMR